jgi:hypothetical protein
MAAFAFKLAREMTGKLTRSYKDDENSRKNLMLNPAFRAAFDEAKRRIRAMDFRFVEERDQNTQVLLEIYCTLALNARYNDSTPIKNALPRLFQRIERQTQPCGNDAASALEAPPVSPPAARKIIQPRDVVDHHFVRAFLRPRLCREGRRLFQNGKGIEHVRSCCTRHARCFTIFFPAAPLPQLEAFDDFLDELPNIDLGLFEIDDIRRSEPSNVCWNENTARKASRSLSSMLNTGMPAPMRPFWICACVRVRMEGLVRVSSTA